MTQRAGGAGPKEGLRERKQRETRLRIAETGLRLFIENGYDATTLDVIAQESGISRRTFFSYFKSKEEIITAWQAGMWTAMWADLRSYSPEDAPLRAVREIMAKQAAHYEGEKMQAIDRVMRASDPLKARKQAGYLMQEEALFQALCEVWTSPRRRAGLRAVAMVAIGAMRLALEGWTQRTDDRSVADYLKDAFASLEAEI